MKTRPEAPGLADVILTILSPLIAGVLLVAVVVGAMVYGCAKRSGVDEK